MAHRRVRPGLIRSLGRDPKSAETAQHWAAQPEPTRWTTAELHPGQGVDLILLRRNVIGAFAGPDPVAMVWIDGHLE